MAESGSTRTVDIRVTRLDPGCPEAEPIPLDCTSGTISGTTVGGPAGASGYCPSQWSQLAYGGPERFYTFRNLGTAPVDVRVVAEATTDHDLFVLESGSGCTSSAPRCAALGTRAYEEDVVFTASAGSAWNFVYGPYLPSAPGPFTLAVSCTPVVCGDGRRSGGEECDDGNVTGGDGCGADCLVEPGFSCACGSGPGLICPDAPSACTMRSGPASCGAATPITGDTSLALGAANLLGGPAVGAGCNVLRDLGTQSTSYFSVTIPPTSRVTVEVATASTFGFSSTIDVLETCDATTCLSAVNGNQAMTLRPVTSVLENTGGTAVTRIVAINNPSATSRGVTFTYASTGG